ncbi:MAG: pimeloyl-ACP methyl esterase BioG family protein [Pseudomonadota bacterium]|jgi:biotin synthesis protein BioG|nr:pimeloyl-ACP methyl esterase BioG family protein [Pseudomonadota bacterium]
MRVQWLQRRGGSALKLVFGGWALGPGPFADLVGEADVLFVDDYRNLETPIAACDDYDELRLFAFSFGVAAAAHWMARTGTQVSRRVALSGTLYPAERARGIAPETVRATAEGLTTQSFAKFCTRAGLRGPAPEIDLTAARDELLAVIARGPAPETRFDRIWIPERDRIIPTAAQECAWQGQTEAVRRVSGPHLPVKAGETWDRWLS